MLFCNNSFNHKLYSITTLIVIDLFQRYVHCHIDCYVMLYVMNV